ncbi:MAG: SMC family ATPase [Candidatus Aenigmarchaeota archaeon]|nr:SMC family ATPase [Candidatus Aenigmarchaeota archaeon]
MITRIRLKNWRSHIDSDMRFGPGVNALVGIMGSGKSSVVQAIAFGLFGTFPQLQSRRMRLDDLILKKPARKARAEVELEFRANGSSYSVKRVIEENKGTALAEFRENGVLLDVNPRGVNELVEKKLQLDYDLFSRAVYSEQNGLDSFLRLPRGSRMEQIDRMLKVDRFERARENAVSLANRIKNGVAEKVKLVADMEKENIAERIRDISGEIARISESFEKMGKDCVLASRQKAALTEALGSLEHKDKELQDIRKLLEGLRAGFNEVSFSLEQKVEKLKGEDIEQMRQRYHRLEDVVNTLENDLVIKKAEEKARREQLASHNASLQTMSRKEAPRLLEKITALEAQNAIYEKLRADLAGLNIVDEEVRLEKARKELYSLQARKGELAKHISDLRGKRKCPVCLSEVEKERKEFVLRKKAKALEGLEAEIAEKEAAVKQLAKDFDILNRQFQELYILEERVKGYAELKAEYADIAGAIEGFRKEAEKTALHLQQALSEGKELETRFRSAYLERERVGQVLIDSANMRDLEAKKMDYFKRIKSLEEREARLAGELMGTDIREMRRELQEAAGQERELKARMSSLEEKLSDRKALLADFNKRIARMEGYRKGIGRDEVIIEQLSLFGRALRLTQDQLREEFLKTVNYIMDKLWQELYPYGDYQGVRLTIDDDYLLQLKGSDGWTSADLISGGERSMACLALRIAFSLAFLPNLKWLILDEPTHNLDSNAIRQLGEILKEKINSYVDQVFLITHEDRICEGLAGTVYRLGRNKDVNEPTRVEGV